MARPGAKDGSRVKSRRQPPKDKRQKVDDDSDSDSGVDQDAAASSSTGTSRQRPAKSQPLPPLTPTMRKIFTDSQQSNLLSECIERLTGVMRSYDKRAAVNELKDCIKIAIRSEPENPHTKPLLEFICRFLVLQSRQEKDESQMLVYQQNDDDDEDESESPDPESEPVSDEDVVGVDELTMIGGVTSAKSSGRSGKRGASSKKAAAAAAAKQKAAAKKKQQAAKKKSSQRKQAAPRLTTLDIVCRDVLIRGMVDVVIVVNINCLLIVRRVMEEVDDMEETTYSLLKNELIEQISRKHVAIRAAAIKALFRFQDLRDEQDIITNAMIFHLNSDPNHKVRQAVLQVIEPTSRSVPSIIKRTRDVKEIVRKTAYHKIAQRIHLKALTIDQRLTVLKNGLTEGNPSVRKVVEKILVFNWLKECKENVVELLALLDTESDPKTVELLLHLIFNSYMAQTQEGKTKLHLFVKQFKFTFLDDRKLLTKKPLDVENAFLWRSLAYFLKAQGDLDPLEAEVEEKAADSNYQSEIDELFAKIELKQKEREAAAAAGADISDPIPGPSAGAAAGVPVDGPTPPKKTKITTAVEVDLLDYILPQLPHICYYIKKFTKKISENDFDDLQLADLDYVYEQLVAILMLVEVGDAAQENILLNMIRAVLKHDNLTIKMKDVIAPLMHVAAKNVFKTPDQLLSFTQELTQDIHNSIYEQAEEEERQQQMETQSEQRNFTPREISEIEMSYARACVQLESAKDDMEQHLRDQDYMSAERVKQQLKQFEKERDFWFTERQAARGFNNETIVIEDGVVIHEPIPSSQQPEKSEPQIADNPIKLQQCLQIFSACMQYGKFREIDSVIHSHVDRFAFSGLLSEQPSIRMISVKILGNCCLISKEFAKKYFALIVQVLHHDSQVVQVQALKALFDIICVYGIAEMRDSQPNEEETSSSVNASAESSHEASGRNHSSFEAGDEDGNIDDDDDGEQTLRPEESQNERRSSGRNASSKSSPELSDQARQFDENLFDMLMKQLDSNYEPIRSVAVKGVYKLVFLKRIKEDDALAKHMYEITQA